MAQKRFPVKERRLHSAGESLEQELEETISDIMVMVLCATLLIAVALFEWIRLWLGLYPSKQSAIVITVINVLLCGFVALRIRSRLRHAKNLSVGAKGEKTVGQFLETLRAKGYQVFHDIPGDGHNIDHVLIGPTGVYTIETKTRMKPEGDARVSYDGSEVRVNGFAPDRDPVGQALAQARELRAILKSSTGKEFFVRPVVVYLGWYVEQPVGKKPEVWVLNEQHFVAFLDHEDVRLKDEDIHLASYHLARHVRARHDT